MRSCVTKLPVLAILASTGSIPRNTDECLTDGSIASTCRIRVPCILWNYYNNCHLPVVLVLMYVHAEYTRQTATFLVCQLLLQSDNCEIMSFLLVVLSRIYKHLLCYFFEARHPSRPTAYPHMGVHTMFPLNITASEVLPPNNHCVFYSLGAPNLVHQTWCT